MKTIYKKFFFLVFLSVTVACSSDDSTSSDDDGGNTGENNTYEIMLTAEGTQAEYSGSMPNESPIAVYVKDGETGIEAVSLQFEHQDLTMTAAFILDDNGQPLPFGEDGGNNQASLMGLITSAQGSLIMTSGNATFSNYQVHGVTQQGNNEGGFASFKVTFEGTFVSTSDQGVTYETSGEVVVNPFGI